MILRGIDDNERYKTEHLQPQAPAAGPVETPQETPPSGAAPTAGPETPAETPGPNGSPQGGQGGPPPVTPPSTPPITGQTGQAAGVLGSETTGGVQGSFAQAGTSDFAKRFGGDSPAVWFRNANTKGAVAPGGPNAGRANVGGVGNVGSAIPSETAMGGPSLGGEGGGKNDEEWQRFIAEVARLRFGQGGR